MKRACIFLLLFPLTLTVFSQQVDSVSTKGYIDQTDLIKVIRGKKKPKENDTGVPEKGKLMLLAVPVFGSNPFLGTFYGLGGTGAIFTGSPETTSISNLTASFLFTTKNQFIGSLKGTVMTPENTWEMLVDMKYAIFSENTYGLGSDYDQLVKESWNIGGTQTTGIEGAQPVNYNQVKFHFTALKQIVDNVYVGIGYHLDQHNKIEDVALDLDAPEPVITSHYAYSTYFGFPTSSYTSSGTSFNIMYDSRDHTVNTYSGNLVHVSYRVNPELLGSEQNYQQLYFETRLFKSLSREMPRHLISLWAIGQFTTSGNTPYFHLPANGYDMRNRIGRGYVAGRFRGQDWITIEPEYRFPITKNGLFGGVIFGSVTTISRDGFTIGAEEFPKLGLFEASRFAGGFGGRVMLNRSGRLNLAIDMAFGENGAKGFYFAISETF